MFSRFKISDKDFSHKLYKCETIENIKFEKCSFVMAKFINCKFKNCEFIGCTFWGAGFENSPLDNAIITCCVGNGKDIINIIKKGWITITSTHINVEGFRWKLLLEDDPKWFQEHESYAEIKKIIEQNFKWLGAGK